MSVRTQVVPIDGENACGMKNTVVGQSIVRLESGALQHMGGILNMYECVGIKTLLALIPEYTWREKQFLRHLRQLHIALKPP